MSPEPCPQALGTALPCSSTPLQPLFVLPSWQVLCLPPPAPGFLPQAPAQAVLWPFPCPAAPGHFSLHLSCQPLQAPRGHNEVTLKLLFRSPAFPCSSSNHSSNIFFLTARNSSPFLPAGLLQLLGKERQVTNILTGKSPMFMRCKETQFTGKCIPDVQPCYTVSDKITPELRC